MNDFPPPSRPADRFGAFCRDNDVARAPLASGALDGLTFAIKDVFDVAGERTGFGHPAWLASHPPADATAPAVTVLLKAGARLVGRTLSDELCYSLSGENAHYGMPINPRTPDRAPGGSSSGSAVAVAAGVVDFAIGTDCGGSVRVPASYCGIFGVRPTHASLPLTGVSPFAPRFDTVGWFARDAATLALVGDVLLPEKSEATGFDRMVLAEDAWERTDPEVIEALRPALRRIESALGAPSRARLSPDGLDIWLEIFRLVQGSEIWASLGQWIEEHRPLFGQGVGDRLKMAASIAPEAAASARLRADSIAAGLAARLAPGDLICLPTTPTISPSRNATVKEIEIDTRMRTMQLLCTAGLGGMPQISIPAGEVDGAPVGLSIMARRGRDRSLLRFAKEIFG